MAAKIAAFIITLIVNIAAGVAVFFIMLLAMNGYAESDANYGLGAYIGLAIIVSLLMATAAAVVAHILIDRRFSGIASILTAVVLFSLVGVVLKIVGGLIGVGIAEFARLNF